MRPGNMSDLHLQGRLKGYLGGVEYYRPFVRTGLHSRPLRRTFRTADGAMRYGQKVVENYKRWFSCAARNQPKTRLSTP